MHRDFEPGRLAYGAPCSISRSFIQAAEKTIQADFAKPEAILMHTCDTGPGSSGSPLLTPGDGGPEVVGINVGTYVLSRPAGTSSTSSPQSPQSEAIANPAIQTDQFSAAVEAFTIETSALPSTARRAKPSRRF
jgi:protease YdgD